MWRKKWKMEKSIEIAQGNGSQKKRVRNKSEDMSGTILAEMTKV